MSTISKQKTTILLFLMTVCLGVLASYLFSCRYRSVDPDTSTSSKASQRHMLVIGKRPVHFAEKHLSFLQGPNTSFWYVKESQPTATTGKLESTHINLDKEADLASMNRILSSLKAKDINLDAILTGPDDRLYKLAAALREQHDIVGTKQSDLDSLPKLDSSLTPVLGEKRYEVDLAVCAGNIDSLSVKALTTYDLDPLKSSTCKVSIDVSPEVKHQVRTFIKTQLEAWGYKNGVLSLLLRKQLLRVGYELAALLPCTDYKLIRQMNNINSGQPCTATADGKEYQARICFSNGHDAENIGPEYRQQLFSTKTEQLSKDKLKRRFPVLRDIRSSSGEEIAYDAQQGHHIGLFDDLVVTCAAEQVETLQKGVDELREKMQNPFAHGCSFKTSSDGVNKTYLPTSEKDKKDDLTVIFAKAMPYLSVVLVGFGMVVGICVLCFLGPRVWTKAQGLYYTVVSVMRPAEYYPAEYDLGNLDDVIDSIDDDDIVNIRIFDIEPDDGGL